MSFIDSDLVQFIVESGVLTVICAYFLRMVQANFQDQREMMKSLFDKIVSNHGVSPEKEKTLYDQEVRINNALRSLTYRTRATRSHLIKYHNGGVDGCGVPFQKMSMTNEAPAPNVPHYYQNFQFQFKSHYDITVKSLLEKGSFEVVDINLLEDKDGLKSVLRERGIEQLFALDIKSPGGNIVGSVTVEFNEISSIPYQEIRDELEKTKHIIESIISETVDILNN